VSLCSVLCIVLLKSVLRVVRNVIKCVSVVIYSAVYIKGALLRFLMCSVYKVTIGDIVDLLTVAVPFRPLALYVVAGLGDCSLLVLHY
jgi:hypothetical protein